MFCSCLVVIKWTGHYPMTSPHAELLSGISHEKTWIDFEFWGYFSGQIWMQHEWTRCFFPLWFSSMFGLVMSETYLEYSMILYDEVVRDHLFRRRFKRIYIYIEIYIFRNQMYFFASEHQVDKYNRYRYVLSSYISATLGWVTKEFWFEKMFWSINWTELITKLDKVDGPLFIDKSRSNRSRHVSINWLLLK